MAVIGRIRQNVGLLVFVIALAILAFLLMDAMSSSQRSGGGLPVAGSIDGTDIPLQTYEGRVQQILNNYQSNQVEVTDQIRYQAREQAWQQQIEDMLARKQYEALGIGITNEEIEQLFVSGDNVLASIKDAPIFKDENGQFNSQKVRDYVANFNSPDNPQGAAQRAQWRSFEEAIISDQMKQKYTNLVKKAVYVPKWQAEMNHKSSNQKADISYVYMPYTNVEDTEITVSDSDLKSYLNKNQNQFKQEASRSVKYVTFPIVASAEDSLSAKKKVDNKLTGFRAAADAAKFVKINGSDTDFNDAYVTKDNLRTSKKDDVFAAGNGAVIGTFYEAGAYKAIKVIDKKNIADSVKVSQILIQPASAGGLVGAKTKIDSLNTAYKAGSDFEGLANAFSDDTSKEKGGDLGYITLGSPLPPALKNAVFFDHKQGDVFTLQTAAGWHLVKVTASNPTTPAVKIAEFTDKVVPSELTRNQAYATAQRFAEESRTLAAFEKNATAKKYAVKSDPNVTANAFKINGLTGLTTDIATWAFQSEVKSVSDRAFQIDEDLPTGGVKTTYIVAALAGAKNKGIATIEDVRTQLETIVKNEKKADVLKKKLGGSASLDQAASAGGAEIKTAEGITFGSPSIAGLGTEPKVQAAVFGMKQGDVSKPIAGTRGVYVVKVDALNDAGSMDLATAKKDAARSWESAADFNLLPALTKAADVKDDRYKTRRY
ncbi:MAG: SurA N-terminal domain-containing protein [Chitinophagales bacterium]